jgi:hypothetical protein
MVGASTPSMLRHLIIGLEDLRRAGKRASDYRGPASVVRPVRRIEVEATVPEPSQADAKSGAVGDESLPAVAESGEC